MIYKERPDPASHLHGPATLRKHKGDKGLPAQGDAPAVQVDGSWARAWLTGKVS